MQLRTSLRNTMNLWRMQGGLTANTPPPHQARAHPRIIQTCILYDLTKPHFTTPKNDTSGATRYSIGSPRDSAPHWPNPTPYLNTSRLYAHQAGRSRYEVTRLRESGYYILEVTIRQHLLALFIFIYLFTYQNLYEIIYTAVTREKGGGGTKGVNAPPKIFLTKYIYFSYRY